MRTKRYKRKIRGTAISPGYAVGLASHYVSAGHVLRVYVPELEIEQEVERLHLALEQSRLELASLRSRVQQKSGEDMASIFDAQRMLLDDPMLLERIEALIRGLHTNADWAARRVLEEFQADCGGVEDEFFKQREMDTWGLFERLHRHLIGVASSQQRRAGATLVADTLNLALLADFDPNDLNAIVVSTGAYTSHTAIIARSYSIPVISGIPHVRKMIPADKQVIVDGYKGVIYLEPCEELVREYQQKIWQDKERYQTLLREERKLPAVTRDGERIILEVNIETEEEITSVLEIGAEGIGLFRSEFLYIRERDEPLSEEKQAAIYFRLAQRLYPLPLAVRTLDIGDEDLPYLSDVKAGLNPILGLRGIRLSLRKPELFKTQVCAILRASTLGNVKLVLPMISSLDELLDAKAMIADAQEELIRKECPFDADIKIGIMMEVPAAFLSAAALAPEVDFLSIGTNDLIQYVLAVDRSNEEIASLYDPLHPAVLRCMEEALRVAAQERVPVRVCGEMASDPIFAMVLIGMGVRNLSMNPTALPYMRHLVRSIERWKVALVAQHILSLRSPREIHRYVREELEPLIPSDLHETLQYR
ncbi:MAG: phosphoenolpyruvate--protein phosphotransferase [Acidobacteria bacterium]|nr:phosphoenolpyruvate--protein phosphotransferase [Acidobacteriota bacterium]